MKPRIPITSNAFRYTDAANTNLRLTFARIRREQRQADERAQAVREEAQAKVASLPRKRLVREESA